ncbi:acyl-CoA dehydrogenase family protein [Croceicoccus sp. BE223]|uniref:acyl-CoA dehydrogenase family protein n=1 Tax=Croceicoccus sp. BE223 TaxID=2817716 RepID=UPI002858CD30|nr:acyl-CoA dehydrogenase family protein [Croceicoccus sp. BE223]MDR7103690.1 alkylation response protein AidB-like acyl-CoA dehydrogenase [Croceicoccus sp. BE223]
MNFDFSDDQEVLRSEARKFLDARCPPSRVRAILDDPGRGHDAELWQELAEQGWTALTIPEEHGGLGMSRTDLCVLAEELGRVLAPVPFASTVFVLAEALMLAGTEKQRERLADIATGECIGCLAVHEGPGEPSRAKVNARVENGLLTGVKEPVIDGMCATDALVWARDDNDVPRLYLVSLAHQGVSRTPLATLDPSRGISRIEFRNVPAEPIGEPELLDRLLDGAAVLLAFEQVGGADRALEQAVQFAKERTAFGREIGSYQAIKHKLADAYVNNQIARSNAYYGIWALDSDSAELPQAAAAARVAACQAMWYAARESIQTHGGIGFTWEADQHLFYRRALHLDMALGSPRVWRDRLFAALEMHGTEAA